MQLDVLGDGGQELLGGLEFGEFFSFLTFSVASFYIWLGFRSSYNVINHFTEVKERENSE